MKSKRRLNKKRRTKKFKGGKLTEEQIQIITETFTHTPPTFESVNEIVKALKIPLSDKGEFTTLVRRINGKLGRFRDHVKDIEQPRTTELTTKSLGTSRQFAELSKEVAQPTSNLRKQEATYWKKVQSQSSTESGGIVPQSSSDRLGPYTKYECIVGECYYKILPNGRKKELGKFSKEQESGMGAYGPPMMQFENQGIEETHNDMGAKIYFRTNCSPQPAFPELRTESKWNCSDCTFLNEANSELCEICNNPKHGTLASIYMTGR